MLYYTVTQRGYGADLPGVEGYILWRLRFNAEEEGRATTLQELIKRLEMIVKPSTVRRKLRKLIQEGYIKVVELEEEEV